MCDDFPKTARLEYVGDHVEGALELWVEQPRDQVWFALTDPCRLADWLAPGRIEPKVGGAVEIDFQNSGVVINSRVTACRPQWLLEYSWSGPAEPARLIRWELFEAAEETKVVLTVRIPRDEDVARAFAGWSAQLTMLAATLAGASTRFPYEQFKADRESYQAQLAAA